MKTNFYAFALILSFTFLSCNKEGEVLPTPTDKSQTSNAKVASVTNLCPNSIRLNGNSPGGNILMAHFDPSNSPARVVVVKNGISTTDNSTTSGNSGMWVSNNKYTSTELGLNLLDQSGNLICSCNYDVNGNLKANALPLQLNSFKESITQEGVEFSWDVQGAVKGNISGYGDLTAQDLSKDSIVVPHSLNIMPPFTLTIWDANGNKLEKTIMACTLDNASAIVTRGPINVYGGYTDNTVTVSWHSTQEETIAHYIIYRFSGYGNYDKGWAFTLTGAGSNYSFVDNEAYEVYYNLSGEFVYSGNSYDIYAAYPDGRNILVKHLEVNE